jgi:hypothetical protein
MSKAEPSKRKSRAGVDTVLTAAERRHVAERLSAAHAGMALWRACKSKACCRRRRCGADVDACGARCSPKGWAWVHDVLAAIRSGTTRRAARRAADRTAQGERFTMVFDMGEGEFDEVHFIKNDDGGWKHFDASAPPSELELQLRRLGGAGTGWLRAAGRVDGEI